MQYCKNCGKELKGEAKFCAHCGAAVNTPASSYPNGADLHSSKKKPKWIIPLICGAAVIAAAAVAAAVFHPFKNIGLFGASSKIQIGDYLQMGTYYDEPVLWRCVDIDENGPLILSDKIICVKPYDAMGEQNLLTGSHSRGRNEEGSNYWGDSNMRSWLNSDASAGNVEWLCGNPPYEDNLVLPYELHKGYDHNGYAREAGFLSNFSPSEKAAIKEVTQKCIVARCEYENGVCDSGTSPLENDGFGDVIMSNYDDAYAVNLSDRVFLLDVLQLNNIRDNSNILGEGYVIGTLTQKAAENNRYRPAEIPEEKLAELSAGNPWIYWLRTPDADDYNDESSRVRGVMKDGSLDEGDSYEPCIGVRPAFYLSDDADIQGDGTIDSPYVISGNNAVDTAQTNAQEPEQGQAAEYNANRAATQDNIPEDEPESQKQSQNYPQIARSDGAYSTYTSTDGGYTFAYPSDFSVNQCTDDNFEATSSDGSGSMQASRASSTIGAEQSMNAYISSVNGNIDYQSRGDDYYAVRMVKDSQYYYKYSKFNNGNEYSFSFIFPDSQFDKYDEYINEVYTSIINQF